LGRVLSKPILDPETKELIAKENVQITPNLIEKCKTKKLTNFIFDHHLHVIYIEPFVKNVMVGI
jgi:hypothetical protein